MPKVLTFTRKSDGQTVIFHPTIVQATGDNTQPLVILEKGTNIVNYFMEHLNDKHYLKNGNVEQFVIATQIYESSSVNNNYKAVRINYGMTINNQEYTFQGYGLPYAWFEYNVTDNASGRPTLDLSRKVGCFFTVNQYNCFGLMPYNYCRQSKDLSVIEQTVYKCYPSWTNNSYGINTKKQGDSMFIGYIGDDIQQQNASDWRVMNMLPSQSPYENATEWASTLTGPSGSSAYPYGGFYWMNYQNEVTPDTPVQPSQVGFPYGDSPSQPQGGDGYMQTESETIEIPPLVESTALTSRFCSLWLMTQQDLNELNSFMWSDTFINMVRGLYNNKDDLIISLSELPIEAPGTYGEIPMGSVPSGVHGYAVKNRYIEKDFGRIPLVKFWGNFLDYAPYTKIELILPYAENVSLNTDLYQGKEITLKCRIDLLSGDMVYLVGNGKSVCEFIGANCNAQIPLTSRDYGQMISNVMTGIGGIVGNGATGNVIGLANSTLNAINSKPRISAVSNLISSRGNMGLRTPFIRITRPTISIPKNFPHEKGFRSNITAKLGTLRGFTKVDTCHLDGIVCTDWEKDEILRLLKEGVIL